MGLRAFVRGIAILAAVAASLLLVTILYESLLSYERRTDSTFVPLVENKTLKPGDISRLDVSLPGDAVRWYYKRTDGLWRLPEFAGAYALNGEVDNIVTQLLQGFARPVGRRPDDEPRYGLVPGSTLSLTLLQDSTNVLRVQLGDLAPGAAKDERYITVNDDETIYLLASNPATVFLDGEPPVMLDKHVLPRAFLRGMPNKITFAGERATTLRQLDIKALPQNLKKEQEDPGKIDPKKKREPTHEFKGTYANGTTKLLDDGEAALYLNQALDIEFDKIVGSISPIQVEYTKFANPILEVAFYFEKADPILFAVSGSMIEGRYPILNRATAQMFIINAEKVEALVPKLKDKQPE